MVQLWDSENWNQINYHLVSMRPYYSDKNKMVEQNKVHTKPQTPVNFIQDIHFWISLKNPSRASSIRKIKYIR